MNSQANFLGHFFMESVFAVDGSDVCYVRTCHSLWKSVNSSYTYKWHRTTHTKHLRIV